MVDPAFDWDPAVPEDDTNSLPHRRGDGALCIRNAKAHLQTALQTDGIFPGSAPTTDPVFMHKFKSGNTAARPAAGFEGRWYWNTQTKTIQRDTGAAWEDLTPPSDLIPAGTVMVFYNSTAPTGWSQVTTWDDVLIRVVSGAGAGSGGTDSIASPPTHDHGGSTDNPDTDLTHYHGSGASSREMRNQDNAAPMMAWTSIVATRTNDADVDHVHTVDADVAYSPKYADMIVCSKD